MTMFTTLRNYFKCRKKDIYLGMSSWTDQIQFVATGSWHDDNDDGMHMFTL